MRTLGPKVRIKNRNRFSIVPDSLLEEKTISLPARLVAAWLVGRSDNFEIRIADLRRILDISEPAWSRIRRELEGVGWWSSERKSGPGGIFVWEHFFEFTADLPIPPKSMDGESIHGNPIHGSSMHGKGGDINTPIGKYQEDFTKKKNNNKTDVVVFSENGKKISDDLKTLNINEKKAKEIVKTYTEERIREVLAVVREKENPAGFLVQALEEGWSFPDTEDKKVARVREEYFSKLLPIYQKALPSEKERESFYVKNKGMGAPEEPHPNWLRAHLPKLLAIIEKAG